MACKGVRPDGNQCDAPEQYVNPATGLCGSCGAPKSMALVPIGSTELMADPEVDALYRALPPKAQAFLNAYTKTYTIVNAAKAADVHRNSHRYWMKNLAGYEELFKVAELDALDHWRHLYADRTENGLKEEEFDADGNLKRIRIRQSEGLSRLI